MARTLHLTHEPDAWNYALQLVKAAPHAPHEIVAALCAKHCKATCAQRVVVTLREQPYIRVQDGQLHFVSVVSRSGLTDESVM